MPRKSTTGRPRSSSVASDASVASAAKAKTATPKSPKAAAAKNAPKSPSKAAPKSPSKAAASKSSKSAAAAAEPKSPGAASEGTPKKAPVTPRKSAAAKKKELTAAQQEAIVNRPKLPKKINPVLPDEDIPVKLQVIRRDNENIIIGRVKLPTVNNVAGHAFLLRRFDTNAIAASSMFRLAFPYANEEVENSEMAYLAQRYDTVVANGGMEKVYKRPRGRPSKKQLEATELPFEERRPPGSTGVQLQGTWVPIADGLELAKEYGLERFARPLIEAKASTYEGVPILTPSVNDKVSTPTSGRVKKALALADDSPTSVRAIKRTKADGTTETIVTSSATGTSLSVEQMEEEIRKAQELAKSVQANGTPNATPARKRRAANQTPSAVIDHLADEEDYENSNVVVRSLRRGTRVARRRPIAATAGALGAVGAVGAGALAWFAGGNLDVATQMVQQGVQSLGQNFGSFFF